MTVTTSASPRRIGVDLGGTKIEVAVLDDRGHIVYRRRVPTPRHDYPGTLRAVGALVTGAETTLAVRDPLPVGVAIPGSPAPRDQRIRNANSTWLNGRRLEHDLAEGLGRPIRLANDANCLALSEAWDGAGTGYRTVFGVILGTGVGGGLVINGELWGGANGIAGEWGHNPLPWPHPHTEVPGPSCYCGRHGCIETFLSGPGLEADHAEQAPDAPRVPAIAARAEAGEPIASACFTRYEHRLARALAHVINLLDPSVIVLGGGLSNLARIYDSVPRYWSPFVFADRVDTPIRPAQHGDSSGIRGAAWLWPAA